MNATLYNIHTIQSAPELLNTSKQRQHLGVTTARIRGRSMHHVLLHAPSANRYVEPLDSSFRNKSGIVIIASVNFSDEIIMMMNGSLHTACTLIRPVRTCGMFRKPLRCAAASECREPGPEWQGTLGNRGIFDLEGCQCGDNVTLFDARYEIAADSSHADQKLLECGERSIIDDSNVSIMILLSRSSADRRTYELAVNTVLLKIWLCGAPFAGMRSKRATHLKAGIQGNASPPSGAT